MRPVAEGALQGMLAVAQRDVASFGNLDFFGRKSSTLVRSVAKRLFRGTATRTPKVFAGLRLENGGGLGGNDGIFAHILRFLNDEQSADDDPQRKL